MSLPSHRRIALGRTFASRWDAARYACAIEAPQMNALLRFFADLKHRIQRRREVSRERAARIRNAGF